MTFDLRMMIQPFYTGIDPVIPSPCIQCSILSMLHSKYFAPGPVNESVQLESEGDEIKTIFIFSSVKCSVCCHESIGNEIWSEKMTLLSYFWYLWYRLLSSFTLVFSLEEANLNSHLKSLPQRNFLGRTSLFRKEGRFIKLLSFGSSNVTAAAVVTSNLISSWLPSFFTLSFFIKKSLSPHTSYDCNELSKNSLTHGWTLSWRVSHSFLRSHDGSFILILSSSVDKDQSDPLLHKECVYLKASIRFQLQSTKEATKCHLVILLLPSMLHSLSEHPMIQLWPIVEVLLELWNVSFIEWTKMKLRRGKLNYITIERELGRHSHNWLIFSQWTKDENQEVKCGIWSEERDWNMERSSDWNSYRCCYGHSNCLTIEYY